MLFMEINSILLVLPVSGLHWVSDNIWCFQAPGSTVKALKKQNDL